MHFLGTDENGTRFVQEDLDRVVCASMCPSNAVLTLGFSDTRYTEREMKSPDYVSEGYYTESILTCTILGPPPGTPTHILGPSGSGATKFLVNEY